MAQHADIDTAVDFTDEQPEARFFGPTPQPVHVQFGAVSDRGKVRPNNEDHYAVIRRYRSRDLLLSNLPPGSLHRTEEEAYVAVVADGMGGAAFGELASMLALRAAWELSERETAWPLNMNAPEAEILKEKFAAYSNRIHHVLLEHGRSEPKTAGMGTTLTTAYTVGASAFIAHVGDSRAYLYRKEAIYQLTRDHTLAQELVDAGMPASRAAKFGHVLTNLLGGGQGQVSTEFHHFRLEDGDWLLLCTDGLTRHVADGEIAGVLKAGTEAQRVCLTLLNLALDRGGADNITVVAGRYRTVAQQQQK
jgi:protein phosphatase